MAYGIDSRVVLTLGLPCLLIYLSLGYAWRVFAFVFLLLFYFFPSPPIRSGEALSSVIFSSLSLLLFVFLGCSDGMEREACVCDHGFERSDLCAEIIIIIMIGIAGGSKVFIRPAVPGTGVIAGGSVRIVLELAGVKNILSKQLGSNNPLNNARKILSKRLQNNQSFLC